MKFTISSSTLNNRLQTLSKVISSKNSLAILDCFLFEVSDNQLSITASDNENVMKTALTLDEVDGEGSFCVPNRTILDSVKELADQPLYFEVNTDDFSIKIGYQNGVYNFTAQSAEAYPRFQSVPDGSTVITIDGGILNESISRSLFATAQDELRPVMNGIYFDLTPECLAIVASDGHKLVRNRNFNIKSEVPASFVLPKKPATLLRTVLTKDSGDVVIKFDSRSAEVRYPDGMLLCRLIEGKYPNYNSVIPEDNPCQLTIDRLSLLGAIRRVLPFATVSTQLIRFHITNGSLKLSSEDLEFNTSAVESVNCEYQGQPMDIGFKGSALTEILSNLVSDEVTILLADPSRAGIVKPSVQTDGGDVVMLIMPMLLND
ncbi:MAG: DNA polymerase III subunit beta [Prevotella sp.]|nr:DNA polymerase III subunit beta [Prevotella sp.]